jgi:integrase
LQKPVNQHIPSVINSNEGVFEMSTKGKIRYNAKIDRYFIDLYWQGKRHHFYKYLGRMPCQTEQMASVLLRDIRSEIDKGVFNPQRYKRQRPMHLAEYAEQWLNNIVVSAGTMHDYKNSLENHILPVLGSEFLPDINYDKLRKLQTSIRRSNKGKYNTMGCLHKLLKDAKSSGHISQMPEFPGFKGKESVVPPPIEWIEEADQWRVINHIPIEDRSIFIFMKITGCRTGEARAFRWIDIKKDHIVFEKAIGYNEVLKEVKGRKAQTFPMTEALKTLMDSLTRRNVTFVFPNPRTNRPYTKHISKIWNRACEDAEVKKVRLYNAMRHSFGCQMLNAGIDKSMVQRLLRHTDPKMTDRYAEYSTNSLKIALDNVVKMPDLKVVKN